MSGKSMISKITNVRNFSKPAFICLLVGLTSLSVRLYFNFSQELIPGVNGGYYPLQVRTLLTTGHLGFSDMPFLFYFDALLVKFISLFGFSITDSLISVAGFFMFMNIRLMQFFAKAICRSLKK